MANFNGKKWWTIQPLNFKTVGFWTNVIRWITNLSIHHLMNQCFRPCLIFFIGKQISLVRKPSFHLPRFFGKQKANKFQIYQNPLTFCYLWFRPIFSGFSWREPFLRSTSTFTTTTGSTPYRGTQSGDFFKQPKSFCVSTLTNSYEIFFNPQTFKIVLDCVWNCRMT